MAILTVSDDTAARRTALMLAVTGALASSVTIMLFAVAGLVGTVLAPSREWATLPLSGYVLGTLAASWPTARLSRQFGRRPVFAAGAISGFIGTMLGAESIIHASFPRFVLAAFLIGIYQQTSNYYRFAAADMSSDEFRPKAISWVLTGGVVAAFTGTLIVMATAHALDPYTYAATFLATGGFALVALAILLVIKLPAPVAPVEAASGRSAGQLLSDARFLAAMLSGMISYGLMNLVMTASPIAMADCGFGMEDSAFALQWHVLAMYVPSFFTGAFITRFGARRITGIGLLILAGSGVAALAGIHFANFALALILLGLGWNFGFIGATALLTATYKPAEATRAQGINELAISCTTALASLSSGRILAFAGWDAVNVLIFPLVAVAGGLLIWLARREGRAGQG